MNSFRFDASILAIYLLTPTDLLPAAAAGYKRIHNIIISKNVEREVVAFSNRARVAQQGAQEDEHFTVVINTFKR